MENFKGTNVGIAYFTNPAVEIESGGRIVNGIMTDIAKSVNCRKVNSDYEVTIVEKLKPQTLPSLIFTDSSGELEHLRIEGNGLTGITVEKVLNIVKDIVHYTKTQPNG